MTYGLSTDRGLGAWRVGWSYGPLASAVYDLDKPIGRSFGDLEYYERSLAGLSGRILEPAVGTGRVLIPLLESGHDVRASTSPPTCSRSVVVAAASAALTLPCARRT